MIDLLEEMKLLREIQDAAIKNDFKAIIKITAKKIDNNARTIAEFEAAGFDENNYE